MATASVKDILTQQGKKRVIQIAQSLRANGKQVTGRTIQSLESKVTPTNKGWSLKILGAKWILTLEPPGRSSTSPGKRGRLYGVILDWVKARGIRFQGKSQKSTAFLISRKIDRQGIKVPNQNTKDGILRPNEQDFINETNQAVIDFISQQAQEMAQKALS